MSDKPNPTTVHDLLLQRMIDQLGSNDTATPGVMNAALRYLKDNGIGGAGLPITDDLQEAVDNYPFQKQA